MAKHEQEKSVTIQTLADTIEWIASHRHGNNARGRMYNVWMELGSEIFYRMAQMDRGEKAK